MPEEKHLPDFEREEYRRISSEILKDRDLQFRIFWQSITVTAVIFSFCASIFESDLWLKFPFVILAPHLILLPSTSIILNRARTANRKSGYVLVVYNKVSEFSNWELNLSRLRERPHRAATIRNMLIIITFLELISILVFFTFLYAGSGMEISNITTTLKAIGMGYLVVYGVLLSKRARTFFCTRYEESIQGYATQWKERLDLDIDHVPGMKNWKKSEWYELRNSEIRNWNPRNVAWWAVWKFPKKGSQENLKPSYFKPVFVSCVVGILLSQLLPLIEVDFRSYSKILSVDYQSLGDQMEKVIERLDSLDLRLQSRDEEITGKK